MAKCTPLSGRPSTGRSRGRVAPPHSTAASKSLSSDLVGKVLPTSVLVTNSMPSSASSFTRRSTMSFSSFIGGMPYISRPPMRSSRSNTVTLCPARFSCAAHARPAGPDPTTATFLPGARQRRLGNDPALGEAAVDDRALDALDGDRRLADAEHARSLARRRTDAAGELGEVVGLVQPRQRLAPLPAVNQIVPLGDEIVDRTARSTAIQQLAGVTEWNAAIHAARALLAQRRRPPGGRETPASCRRAPSDRLSGAAPARTP